MTFLQITDSYNAHAFDVKVIVCNTKLSDNRIGKGGKKLMFCSRDGCRAGHHIACFATTTNA